MRRRARCPRGECCADLALSGYLLSQIASQCSDHCCLLSLGAPGLRLELVRRTGSNSALDCDGRPLRGRRSLVDDSSCAETLNLIQVKKEFCSSQDGYVRFGSKADITRDQLNVRFTPKSGHTESSGCGGLQRNMEREIDANWSRQSRQFAA